MIFSEAAQRALSVVCEPTERDRQKKIGPSELGDMCQLCLAEKLLGTYQEVRNGTALAPLFGTAMHEYLEEHTDKHDVLIESKVKVGTINGYGDITGTVDRFDIADGQVIDYKCLSIKKAQAFRSIYRVSSNGSLLVSISDRYSSDLRKYYHQVQLYGKGMEDLGHKVTTVSLLVLPRDATIHTVQQDVVELAFPYVRDVAESVLERAQKIFDWTSEPGNDVKELDSDQHCYYCNNKRQLLEV